MALPTFQELMRPSLELSKSKLGFTEAVGILADQLNLSEEEIHFRFSPDSLEPTCTERIKLKNPGNAPCTYKWSAGKGGVFMASPKQGTVEAYGEEECIVTWQPVPKGVKEDGAYARLCGRRVLPL